MNKTLLLAAMAFSLFQACKDDNNSNNTPEEEVIPEEVVIPELITINDEGLYPEGIDFNTLNNQFLVGSFTRGELGYINTESGDYTTFITDDNLTNVAGVFIDEARNRVLAASGNAGVDGEGNGGSESYLGIYNLEDGSLIRGIDLKGFTPNGGSFPNDIALDPSGNIYVTDSFSPIIYLIDGTSLEASVFVNGGVPFTPAENAFGLNGIAYIDGALIVNKLDDGALFRIALDNPSGFTKIETAALMGADGLEVNSAGNLVVIENGLGENPGAHELITTGNWATATERNLFSITAEKFPTTAALAADGNVYVLNAYLSMALSGDLTQPTFSIQRIIE